MTYAMRLHDQAWRELHVAMIVFLYVMTTVLNNLDAWYSPFYIACMETSLLLRDHPLLWPL